MGRLACRQRKKQTQCVQKTGELVTTTGSPVCIDAGRSLQAFWETIQLHRFGFKTLLILNVVDNQP